MSKSLFASRVQDALGVIDAAIAEWKLRDRPVIALFSGGGDSTVAAHIAAQHPNFFGCLFIDTGTALPGVYEHIVSVCSDQGWPLIHWASPQSYEDMIREAGLPGPGQHPMAYVRLKEKALDDYVRTSCTRCKLGEQHREHDRIVWISGARSSESDRRMRNAAKYIERDGSQVWCNIILDWDNSECRAYRELHSLPTSDVAALIHRSGECNCGTYAQPGERAMLCSLFPEFARKVEAWEALALESGHPDACVWGQRPLKIHKDQMELVPRSRPFLCSDCERRAA